MLTGIPEKGVLASELGLTVYGSWVLCRAIRHRLRDVFSKDRYGADHDKTAHPQGQRCIQKGESRLEIHLKTQEGILFTGFSKDRSQMKNVGDLMGHHGAVEISARG